MNNIVFPSTVRSFFLRHEIFDRIRSRKNISVSGLSGSLKGLFLSFLIHELERPVLVVMPDEDGIDSVVDEGSSEIGEESVAAFFPGIENVEIPVLVNPHRTGTQMRILRDLSGPRLKMVVTSTAGILEKLPAKETIREKGIRIEENAVFDLRELVEDLVRFGYSRESMVERPGEISVRGGILDIFPLTGEEPLRLEFLGNEIESLRTFDVATQLSTGKGPSVELIPSPLGWEKSSVSLLSYLSPETIVFLQDVDLRSPTDSRLQGDKRFWFDFEEIVPVLDAFQQVTYRSLSRSSADFDLGGRSLQQFGKTSEDIRHGFSEMVRSFSRVFLLVANEARKGRILEFLEWQDSPDFPLTIETGSLRQGFILESERMAVYTEDELLGRAGKIRRHERFGRGVPIRELSSIKRGDFVVHIDHGIGQYLGLEKLTVQGVQRECLAIGYKDGDKLFVPVDKMERVQKYASREGAQPVLTKLGGEGWEKIKTSTKKSIKNIAKDLLSIYSARQSLPGFGFSKDTPWQKELEDSFQYEETADQRQAIDNVRTDMENTRPMDRLVCGDVGYGKTEVAVRAAFKAVSDGKQVAMLVPTTILAQQHFRTFHERLGRFPVSVDVLSRFRTPKEQKDVLSRLGSGKVDIVIGTHRLLSKDVRFHDLGLLIIDEEQRFGVRHKEKLKSLKKTVDVLALSATPIPRTLHLSLLKIRDMSLIATPPKDRLPILTEVVPFSEAVVVKAIEHELGRQGQIFFVHNRIRSIYAVARMIERLIPGIRMAVAHGQMHAHDLEKVMVDFMNRRYDCLVSTMIVESGLDLPNVNTLIVHRADHLGLAQLYQLRGRVGRSGRKAYAYLLTPPFHLLTEDAIKRLRTIEEFTELGSGYQIALKDLEIRGAGNMLGVEQSGYMDAVGFELYMKLVEESMQELKEEQNLEVATPRKKVECQILADVPALLPESYVESEDIRIDVYRRLSTLRTEDQLSSLTKELQDRFGGFPQETQNLLQIVDLKLLAESRGIQKIVFEGNRLSLHFDQTWMDAFPSSEQLSSRLRSIVDLSPVPVRFLQGKEFGLRLSLPTGNAFEVTKKFLQRWD